MKKLLRYWVAKTPARRVVVETRHRGLRQDDTFLGAYPRSGSTWVKFMLYQACTGELADFLNDKKAVPHVGGHASAPTMLPDGARLIKTHEPYRPDYRRGIYVVRDVRDVAVAEYAFNRWRGVERGDFPSFVHRFVQGRTHGWGFGSWFTHVESWLDAAEHNPGLHIVRYEDLKADTQAALAGMLEHLEIQSSEETIERIVADNTVARMKEREDRVRQVEFKHGKYKDGLRFVRSGKAGGWKEELSPELVELLEARGSSLMARLGYEPRSAGV